MKLSAEIPKRTFTQALTEIFSEIRRVSPTIPVKIVADDSSLKTQVVKKNSIIKGLDTYTIVISKPVIILYLKLFYANGLYRGTYLGYLAFLEIVPLVSDIKEMQFSALFDLYLDESEVKALIKCDRLENVDVLNSREFELLRDITIRYCITHEFGHVISQQNFLQDPHLLAYRPILETLFDEFSFSHSFKYFHHGNGMGDAKSLNLFKSFIVEEVLIDLFTSCTLYKQEKKVVTYREALTLVRNFQLSNLVRNSAVENIVSAATTSPRDMKFIYPVDIGSLARLRFDMFAAAISRFPYYFEDFEAIDPTYNETEVAFDLADLSPFSATLGKLQEMDPSSTGLTQELIANIIASDNHPYCGFDGFVQGFCLINKIQYEMRSELSREFYIDDDATVDDRLDVPLRFTHFQWLEDFFWGEKKKRNREKGGLPPF